MKEIKISSAGLTKLFSSIGGEPALENILERFYQKMSQDLLIGYFFDHHDVRAIARKQKEFLMRAWGITPSYSGKAPADAHKALPQILRGHFDRRLVLLAETLREFKVSETDITLWVSFEDKFRDGIVTD